MKFYGSLCLLLAMFVRAQDDNPTGDDVGAPQVPQVPSVVQPKMDDNPSQSDILEGKVNATVSTTPSVTPRVDDSALKSNGVINALNGMYILAMMFIL